VALECGTGEQTTPQLDAVVLSSRIGEGAYADVWLGRDAAGRWIAVKIVRVAALSSSAADREERGIRLVVDRLGECSHTVQILHVGRERGVLFYTMELADDLVSGQSLQNGNHEPSDYKPLTLENLMRKRGAMSVDEIFAICIQVLEGIEAVHSAGLLHRDVKPANLLRVKGQWKLADFGLMTSTEGTATCVGTAAFMPQGGTIDVRGDLFALGKTIYCAITGASPADFPTLPVAWLRGDTPRHDIRRAIQLFNKACDPDPRRRFQSAREMLDAMCAPPRRQRSLVFKSLAGVAALLLIASGLAVASGSSHNKVVPGHPQGIALKPIRWAIADGGNGHRYQAVVTPNGISWEDARLTAEKMGGYLVTLTSEAEAGWVFDQIANNSALWIQDSRKQPEWFARDSVAPDQLAIPDQALGLENGGQLPLSHGPWIGAKWSDGAWHWISGEQWNFTEWAIFEPYPPDQHDMFPYVYLYNPIDHVPARKWDNDSKMKRLRSFIVEYE
jgi:serine/threonine protein kinase